MQYLFGARMFGVALALLLSATVLACTPDAPTGARPIASGDVLQVAADGVTLWYNQPSAVHYVGQHDRTYFAWVTSAGAVQVRHYDHRAESFSPAVTVHEWGGTDDHSAPSIDVIRTGPHAGQLLLAFAFHSTPLLATRTLAPESIDQWAPIDTLHDFASYPRIVTMQSGTAVLLFRSFTNLENTAYLSYATSHDGGRSWSPAIEGIRVAAGELVYGGPATAAVGRVGVSWSVFNTPSNLFRPDLYYAELDPMTGRWFAADGAEIGAVVPATISPAVVSPDGRPVRAWDTQRSADGIPHLAFVSFEGQTFRCCGGPGGTAYWSRFDPAASRWITGRVGPVSSMLYAGGAVLDASDPRTVYLADPIGGTGSQIVEVRTPDNGATWSRVRALSNPGDLAAQPQAVRNGSAELPVTWLHVHEYNDYTDFRTSLVAVRLR